MHVRLVESGEIMQFIIENKNKPYLQCRQLSQTLKHSHMTLRNIISSYNENSIGPAKREVYEQEIAIIPGKPINARVVQLQVQLHSHGMLPTFMQVL